jgi:hypothetical protein
MLPCTTRQNLEARAGIHVYNGHAQDLQINSYILICAVEDLYPSGNSKEERGGEEISLTNPDACQYLHKDSFHLHKVKL